MGQVVASKHEALNSNPNTIKKKKPLFTSYKALSILL
jgi:hypothetical protein